MSVREKEERGTESEREDAQKRERKGEGKEKARKRYRPGSPPQPGRFSPTWGTKKLSYNCCTPRGASRGPSDNCYLLPRSRDAATGAYRTTRRTSDRRRVLDRPRYRLTSSTSSSARPSGSHRNYCDYRGYTRARGALRADRRCCSRCTCGRHPGSVSLLLHARSARLRLSHDRQRSGLRHVGIHGRGQDRG